MLLKIDIQGESGHFYGNSKGIDASSGEIYKSNIMPCKTTILGMLCYYYGIEFDDLDNNGNELKYTFINDFKYGITNNSNTIEKETKEYTSKFHRTDSRKPAQLFLKEYTKNIDFELYINIQENSLLLEYIKDSIKNNNFGDIPGLGDKHLFPDVFNVNILNNKTSNIINNYKGKLLTNMFLSKGHYYIQLGQQKENFLLSYNRYNYDNNKKDFIIGLNNYDFNFEIENEDVIIVDSKGIILY